MKRAIILHGYRSSPLLGWYLWVARQLRKRGYQTWVPRLPMSSRPDGHSWTNKLLARKDWTFDGSLIIGHSAGSVEVLNLLASLPAIQKAKTVVLVSAPRLRLQWWALKRLVPEPLNFDLIKTRAERFILIHAQDDPVCPVDDARYYAGKLDGELVILPKGGHFSIARNLGYWRFPELIRILEQKKAL